MISGCEKFNLFEGKVSKGQIVAGRLSSVLGFPVNKEIVASPILCLKCRRELEKFEKLIILTDTL